MDKPQSAMQSLGRMSTLTPFLQHRDGSADEDVGPHHRGPFGHGLGSQDGQLQISSLTSQRFTTTTTTTNIKDTALSKKSGSRKKRDPQHVARIDVYHEDPASQLLLATLAALPDPKSRDLIRVNFVGTARQFDNEDALLAHPRPFAPVMHVFARSHQGKMRRVRETHRGVSCILDALSSLLHCHQAPCETDRP
ncbi:hypothetical protein [Mollivirus kamchatka]|nr:hypothetical protein [Mollivirus kamchatka]